MPNLSKKVIYVGIIGVLTSTAATAAYWQTNRYIQAKKRWKLIAEELSK